MNSWKLLLPMLLVVMLACVHAGAIEQEPAKQTPAARSQQPTVATPTPNITDRPIGLQLVSSEELHQEVCAPPKDNHEREQAVANLFIQAGAAAGEIKYQPINPTAANSIQNVYVIKPGRRSDIIVVGGHLDRVAEGDGVIDDWSGTTAMTNIYQAFKNITTEHTFIFIGFAGEESGLLGAKAYLSALDTPARAQHKAMLNLECLGAGPSHIWTTFVDPGMKDLLVAVAEHEQIELLQHDLRGVSADSLPFLQAGIPSMTLDGLPKENFHLIHSSEDKCANLAANRYHESYRLAVAYLLKLDKTLAEKN